MGDIILLVIVVVGLGVPAAVLAEKVQGARRHRALGHMPTALLSSGGDGDVYLAKARSNWLLAQRAVRIFERELEHDTTMPFLSHEDRAEIQSIVNKFYEEASR